MEQNYRALHLKFDGDYKFCEFLSASEEFIPEELKAALEHGPLTCKPRFVIYCEGEKKDEIDGADFTKLENSVQKYLPVFDE